MTRVVFVKGLTLNGIQYQRGDRADVPGDLAATLQHAGVVAYDLTPRHRPRTGHRDPQPRVSDPIR